MERWQRLTAILDVVAGAGHAGASVLEISERLDLPRATAYRLLHGLAECGILVVEPSGNYTMGLKVLEWAGHFLAQSNYIYPLQAAIDQVTAATGLFSYAALMQDDAMVCVAIAQPRRIYPVYVRLGARLPLRASAAAKVLLAALPTDAARDLLEHEAITGWEPTAFTLSVDGAVAELREVRQKRWAVCLEELEVGNSALAVPVGPRSGIAVVGATAVLAARQEEILNELQRAAETWQVAMDLFAKAGGV